MQYIRIAYVVNTSSKKAVTRKLLASLDLKIFFFDIISAIKGGITKNNGCHLIASVKHPLINERTALVIPQEGQGIPKTNRIGHPINLYTEQIKTTANKYVDSFLICSIIKLKIAS